MSIILRTDQERVLRDARAALKEHQSIIIQCATGWGKTVFATKLIQNCTAKGLRSVFAVHRQELIKQTNRTYLMADIDAGILVSGVRPDPYRLAQIASVDSLKSRLDRYPADLLIVDEAHLYVSATRKKVIEHYAAAGAKIVNLTATPRRLDGRPMSDIASHIVHGPSVEWLIGQGYLSRYRPFVPFRPDLGKLGTRYGDYIQAQVAAMLDRPSVIGDAVAAYHKHAMGKLCIVFACSREHGKRVRAAYEARGIPAVYMDGESSPSERHQAITMFAERRAPVLVNVQLCTEGFDLSAQIGRDVPIEAGQFLRPTKSVALAMQMIGRALRPKPEPAILLDHANLFLNHGLPDDKRDWNLDGVAKGHSDRAAPVCVCHACYGAYRPAPVCPHCGEPRLVEGREVDEREGELTEADVIDLRRSIAEINAKRDKEAKRREFHAKKDKCKTLDDYRALAREYGYKSGWAWHRYNLDKKKRHG